MRYSPLHKPTVNESHKLNVRDVSWPHLQRTYKCSGWLCIVTCLISMLLCMQFKARASANLTLVHASCPAGFETVQGIISEQYVCHCSKTDLNIQSCNYTTEDVLLKVRVLCVWCGVLIVNHILCSALHCLCIFLLNSFSWLCSPLLCSPLPQPFCALPSHVPCRTGCGALPSPTQTVPRSCLPQTVPVVTATASRGTQTMGQSAGSLCLRTWPRGTSSALATEKVHIDYKMHVHVK